MQQQTAMATSPATPSFAGLLAALAAPAEKPEVRDEARRQASAKSSWADDGLEDDIATLSYEHALKAHARYRTTVRPMAESVEQESQVERTAESARAASCREVGSEKETVRAVRRPFEQTLKSASITIRLSKVECEQLHRRAADAGLTVSAYLRSCTFEAESLRAMVKDTLAELRLAKAQARPADPEPPRRSWLRRLFTSRHGGRGARA